MMFRATAALLLAAMMASPTAAQSRSAVDRNQSIGGGVHWPLGYGRDVTPGGQVSWRRWWSPHVGVGTDFRWLRKTTTIDYDSHAQQGPGDVVVPSMQGRDLQQRSSYGWSVGVLAKAVAGRVSFVGGIGPEVFVDRTSHDTRINEWQSAGSLTQRSIGVHMSGEVEVRATARVSAFAGLRIALPDVRVLESNFGYPTAGVRFAF